MSEFINFVFLANKAFYPGLEVLMYSLNRNNDNILDKCNVTIIKMEEFELLPYVKKYCNNEIALDKDKYDRIPLKPNQIKYMFYKFDLFNDFGSYRNIYLDSDMLCVGDIFDLVHINKSTSLYMVGEGHDFKPGHKNLQAGLIVIDRPLISETLVNHLIDRACIKNYLFWEDQAIVNDWIYEEKISYEHVPGCYNVFVMGGTAKFNEETGFVNNAKILHYVGGTKPWMTEKPKHRYHFCTEKNMGCPVWYFYHDEFIQQNPNH